MIENGRDGLVRLLVRQLDTWFGLTGAERGALDDFLDAALARTAHNFARTANKYYQRNGQPFFSPFHSGQYTIFLYYLSNSAHHGDHPDKGALADKVYYLNKVMNGLDLFHAVDMPAVFHLDHPVGSVMGRACYGDGFTFAQGCTVGNNHDRYPVIGRNVQMFSDAKIIGGCTIGDDVQIAANAYVKDTDIPANTIVFGQSPDLVLKPRRR